MKPFFIGALLCIAACAAFLSPAGAGVPGLSRPGLQSAGYLSCGELRGGVSDNATGAVGCGLNLVLSVEYAAQAVILLVQSQNSEDPLGDLFAAGITFMLALSWYADFLDCAFGEEDNETASTGRSVRHNHAQEPAGVGFF